MKLLLDENLPKRLKIDFPLHTTFTVFEMGWGTGYKIKILITRLSGKKVVALSRPSGGLSGCLPRKLSGRVVTLSIFPPKRLNVSTPKRINDL
jgi:hypothetical protein